MTKITFAECAWDDYIYWQTEDKKTLRKINMLLKEIQRSPYGGMGKPEPLRKEKGKKWSRRINSKDRLVYEMENDMIVVKQCRGHYDDK